jgi:putative flippase GtrA
MSRFSKYTLVGLISLVIDNLIIFSLSGIYGYIVARSISYVTTNTLAFIAHSAWSFEKKINLKTFLYFILFNSISVFTSYLFSLYLNYFIFSDTKPLLSTNIAAGSFFLINYFVNKSYVFKN